MKKLSLIALAVFGFSQIASAAEDTTAQVDFTGQIVADSCVVSVPNQTVDFGQVSRNTLANVGDLSEKVAFNIQLDSCEVGQPVTLKYSGAKANGIPDTLAVDGTAEGVGVKVFEEGSETAATIDENVSIKEISSAGESIVFPFEAAYIAIGEVTSGTANSVATFDIVYP